MIRQPFSKVLAASAVVAGSLLLTVSAGATTSGTSTSLVNGTFSQPALSAGGYSITNQSNVPGWSSTGADGAIEVWNHPTGPAVPNGNQSVELDANVISGIYQDLALTPGVTYLWSVQHAGRCSTADVANVKFGSASGSLSTVAVMSDSNSGWTTYSGTYTVPAGQTLTRFELQGVSTGCSNGPSYGNEVANVLLTPDQTDLPAAGITGVVGVTLLAGAAFAVFMLRQRRRPAQVRN